MAQWFKKKKKSTCQCRRQRFDSWIGKIFWSRKCPPIPVFFPGKFHRQRNFVGHSPWDQVPKSWTWLSDSICTHHLIVPKFIRLRLGRRVVWRWWGGGMNNQRFLPSRTPPGSRLEKGDSYLSSWSTMTVQNPREPQIQKESAPLITLLPWASTKY